MGVQPVKAVLRGWQQAAPPVLRQALSPDGCIAATRIAERVLTTFGLEGEAREVQALLFNEAFMVQVRERGGWPGSRHELDQICEAGGWSVGLGTPGDRARDATRWPGHLVWQAEGRWVVDGALRQARRPEQGLTPPEAVVLEVHDEDRELARRWYPDRGVLVIYRDASYESDFRTVPDWAKPGRYDEAVEQIIAGIEQHLS